MPKLSLVLTAVLLATGLMSSGCDSFLSPKNTTDTVYVNTCANSQIDTMTLIGTPVLDSLKLSLSVVPQNSSGTAIQLSNTNITFTIDSTSTHSTSYILTTYLTTNNVASGKPIASQLVFDGSSSMITTDPQNLIGPAGKSFINILKADNTTNKVAIAEFGNSSYDYYFHLWRNFTALTSTTYLFSSFDSLSKTGSTPLYTSIRRGLEHTDSAITAAQYNRSVVAFTDGGDNASYTQDSLRGIINVALAKHIPVSVIGLGNTVEYAYLQQLASATGGVFAPVDSSNALSTVFSAMATGISSGYTTVIAKFNTLPVIGTKFYITITITSGGTTVTKHIVVVVTYVTQKRRALSISEPKR